MMKSRLIFLLFVSSFALYNSCNKIIFREITCRDFEYHDELKWYPGNVGDTVTLVNEINDTLHFVVKDKYILHRTKYISDTGCGCLDSWGKLLIAENDTISMYSDARYVEKNPANRYDRFNITFKNVYSGFITEDKTIEPNYTIDNVVFDQVLVFSYGHTDDNQFNKIVIAPEIGVAELTDNKGTIWKNANLETRLNIEWNSFDYIENTCD